jgi:hypothetical protein
MIYVDWYDVATLVYQHNLNIALSSFRLRLSPKVLHQLPRVMKQVFSVISNWCIDMGCLLTSEKAIKHKPYRHTGCGDGVLVVEWTVNAEMWRR